MSSPTAVSPPDPSGGDGPAAPSTDGSNFTLLYIIIAVVVGVILYMAIRYGRSVLAQWRQLHDGAASATTTRLGLSADDIAALPTFTYRSRASAASPHGGGRGRSGGKGRTPVAVECVVCLQEMEDGDVVRVMPACRHFFHGSCIDAWLRAHSTCPVCRAHPEPELARLPEAAISPPLPQLRRCGVSPERPTAASRVLADILARSPLRSSGSTSGPKETTVSKSPSPRLHFGSRSPSPTPPVYGGVYDRFSKSPPLGASEIVLVPSKSPSPMRISGLMSARTMGALERIEVLTSASPSPVQIREDGGGSLSKSPSPVIY